MVYSVRDWAELYENAETRKRKQLGWVLVPNRHDSLAFCKLMAQGAEGLKAFAIWNLVLQIASRGPASRRGLLMSDDGIPYTALDIAIKTRTNEADVAPALEILVGIGWLTRTKSARHPDASGCHADESAAHPDEDSKESKKEKTPPSPPRGEGGGQGIPETLNNEKFLNIWGEWLSYLGPKAKPKTLALHLEDLAQAPAQASDRLLTAIKLSLLAPARLSEQKGASIAAGGLDALERKIDSL